MALVLPVSDQPLQWCLLFIESIRKWVVSVSGIVAVSGAGHWIVIVVQDDISP